MRLANSAHNLTNVTNYYKGRHMLIYTVHTGGSQTKNAINTANKTKRVDYAAG